MLELSYWVNTIKCGIFLCAISPNHQPTHPLSRCVSTTPTGRHIHPRTLPSGRQSTLQWVRRMPVALHTKSAQLPYVAKGNKLKNKAAFIPLLVLLLWRHLESTIVSQGGRGPDVTKREVYGFVLWKTGAGQSYCHLWRTSTPERQEETPPSIT